MKIFDPRFVQRIQRLLQTRGLTEVPLEVPFAGLVITIPGDLVLENAAAMAGARLYGSMRIVGLANPAAGADWTLTSTADRLWKVHSITAFYQASAAAATRIPRLSVSSGGNRFATIPALATVTANQLATITWAPGVNSRASAGGLFEYGNDWPNWGPAPSLVVAAVTGNIQAGDQWSGIFALIEEFFV